MIHAIHQHPEIIFRNDVLLRSINDRLGALCGELEAGISVPPLTTDFLDEIQRYAEQDLADIEAERERDRKNAGST